MDLAAGLTRVRTGFTRTFWVANTLELFERFAFYGSKAVLAVYLAKTVGLDALGIKLVGMYGLAVFGLPILAGPVVDRFGFKKSLLACFSIFGVGYLLIGLVGLSVPAPAPPATAATTAYVVAALLVTAIGGSLIKPCIVGTVARTSNPETKSLGYSIYYMLVNFGGALGPILALAVREKFGIAYVLIMCSGVSFLNMLGTAVFFREPAAAEGEKRTFGKVLADAGMVFTNARFISFLVIFSGFWIMFWQIFYALPFYCTDILKFEKFELLETVDAWSIILLSVPVTALMKKVPPILAMTAGFAVASASWLVIAFSQSWQGVVVAMFMFALGEAMQAPRFYEYVSDLAPKEQIGTYMGFAFLPVAIGAFVAGFVSSSLKVHFIDTHKPVGMWVILSGIGFGTTVLMVLYDRFVAKKAVVAI